MFEALGRFGYRRRWAVAGLALATVVVSVLWGLGVFGALSDGGFEDPDSESARARQVATERLGRDDPDVVVLFSSPTLTVDDPAFRDAATRAMDAWPDEEIEQATSYWSTSSPQLVSEDRRTTAVVLQLRGAGEEERAEAYTALQPQLEQPVPGLDVLVGGDIPLDEALGEQVGEDIARAEILSMPLVLLLLLVVFGGLAAASLPLVIGGLAVLGSFTVLRLITLVTDVSIFSVNIVTMLGLGLAIDYALFVVSRFREEMRRTTDVEAALVATMATAGRTVAFSGVTVAISLCSLLLFPQVFLRSMGFGGMAAVLIAMLGALTVLPALLAFLGPRVDALRLPIRRRETVARHLLPDPGTWYRLAHSVMRRPLVYVAVIVPVLLLLGSPFLRVVFGTVDYRVLPEHLESRVVAQRLAEEFPGGADPVEAVVTFAQPVATAATQQQLDSYVTALRGLQGVRDASVDATADRTARVVVDHGLDAQSEEARQLLDQVRALAPPPGAEVLIDGPTAQLADLLSGLAATLPWMALAMVVATLLLLFLAFGSVVLPIKAVLINFLSLSASFGALVWVFQDGNLSGLLGFTPTGTVEATQPILMLAIAFGLSMDYEVFLLSRVREQWDRTHDNEAAVASGLQATGRIITSAALLLIVVFGAFATSGVTFIKMIGVGMVLAIVIDATVVRTLLVPATMRLLGSTNWWAPAPLARFWDRHGFREGDSPAVGRHSGRPAPADPTGALPVAADAVPTPAVAGSLPRPTAPWQRTEAAEPALDPSLEPPAGRTEVLEPAAGRR